MSSEFRIEYVDYLDRDRHGVTKTGAVSNRAVFEAHAGERSIGLVVSGVTYSLMSSRGLAEDTEQIVAFLREHAPREIERLYREGALEEQPRDSDGRLVVDLTEFNVGTG